MAEGKIILITGGARSGKSSFALELAESISTSDQPKRLFVATCPNTDSEMKERVSRHQIERQGRGWDTIECELDLHQVLSKKNFTHEVILVDCLTLWVNNVLYYCSNKSVEINDTEIRERCLLWLNEAMRNKSNTTIIFVTNEVGLGIVPDNALARKYRDLVGTVNQCVGKSADDVVLVSCGIPHYLKGQR